jgi:hypothetical protein
MTKSSSEGDYDLFSDRIKPRAAACLRGRPQHTPTQDTETLVRTLSDLGWPRGRIAEAIGITQPTLRLRYRNELEK